MKNNGVLAWLTDVFENIISDSSVQKLCDSVNEAVPSQFKPLEACGLFSNGLSQITNMVQDIKNCMDSFKSEISAHNESVVSNENYLAGRLDELATITVGASDLLNVVTSNVSLPVSLGLAGAVATSVATSVAASNGKIPASSTEQVGSTISYSNTMGNGFVGQTETIDTSNSGDVSEAQSEEVEASVQGVTLDSQGPNVGMQNTSVETSSNSTTNVIEFPGNQTSNVGTTNTSTETNSNNESNATENYSNQTSSTIDNENVVVTPIDDEILDLENNEMLDESNTENVNTSGNVNMNTVNENVMTDDNKSDIYRNVVVGGLGTVAAAGVGLKMSRSKEKGEKDEN